MVSKRSQATAFLLSYFMGLLGLDRFYLGQIGLGVLKLLTCGGASLWALADLVLIGGGAAKDAEELPLAREAPVGNPSKSQMTAFVLAALLGWCGADHFYLGSMGLGVLKLLTCGGAGIWWVVDVFITGMGSRRDSEGNSLVFPA